MVLVPGGRPCNETRNRYERTEVKHVGGMITEAGDIVGTPGYVAPEVRMGGAVTTGADQWALGRLLVEAACPSVAAARTRSPTNNEGIDWTRFPADPTWHGLRAILTRMLDDAPDQRFGSMVDVHVALSAALR